MIRLSEWFQINTRRPLAWAAGMVLVLGCSIAFVSYIDNERIQQRGFSQLLDVTALAMSQKNRMLIESILNTAQTQTHAISVAICSGSRVALASTVSDDVCQANQGWITRTLREPIPGFSDYSLSMTFSRSGAAGEQIVLLMMALGLVALTLVVLLRVQRKFEAEVVEPLRDGVLGSESLQIVEFEDLRRAHHATQEAKTEIAVADAIFSIARQVSHDIRSPLSALNLVMTSLREVPEEKRLIVRCSVRRINEIANGLLSKSKMTFSSSDGSEAEKLDKQLGIAQPIAANLIFPVLERIVSEKRVQLSIRPEIELHADIHQALNICASISPVEFENVLSNLINNSIEAMDKTGGRITVAARVYSESLTVVISDNGSGIPDHVLARLGEHGVSFGKEGTESGSGLGIYYAKMLVERIAGGKLRIQSKEGEGTIITMTLARASTPEWLAERIEVPHGGKIVVIGGNQSILEMRHSSYGRGEDWASSGVEFTSISPLDLTLERIQSFGRDCRFLIDYEADDLKTNVLDLIERARIADRSLLVTSEWDDRQLQDRTIQLGVKVLPRFMTANVLRVFTPAVEHCQA